MSTSTSEDPARDPGLLPLLVRLRETLLESALPLDAADAAEGIRTRDAILTDLDDHLISRLIDAEAPLLVVVGGSTGAGKSTLVNSILGRTVTEAGVLRPTTRSPVLAHHVDDVPWLGSDRLLPTLRRTEHPTRDPHAIQLVEVDTVPKGMALIDAPDVDSVEEGNRQVAAQLFAAADLWLFVTSAARYADQVPWDHLREAAMRGTSVALVLDRTRPDVIREVGSHLSRMMESRGLRQSRLFMVAETTLDDGQLPEREIREVRAWLAAIAADEEIRAGIIRQTVARAVRQLPERVDALVSALRTQQRLVAILSDEVSATYSAALTSLDPTEGLQVESPAIASAWSEFVGSHGRFQGADARQARVQNRLRSGRKGHPARDLVRAVGDALEARIVDAIETAAERASAAWAATPSGLGLLDAAPEPLGRAASTLASHTHAECQLWLEQVRELVEELGVERKVSGDSVGFGTAGVTALLSASAVAVPAGASDVLADSIGAEAAAAVLHRAHLDLRHRVHRLVRADQVRFTTLLDSGGVTDDGAVRVQRLGHELVARSLGRVS